MKIQWFIAILMLAGCTTVHKFPSKQKNIGTFEYCGGELWGYMLPIGPRDGKPWYSKDFNDPMPLLAVYLHMHSDLAKDPRNALMLFLDIRSRRPFSVEIPNPNIEVQINNLPTQYFTADLKVVEEVKTADEKFPSPSFETKLLNAEKNQWKVTKLNRITPLIKGDSEIVIMPRDRIYDLGKGPKNIPLDVSSVKQLWIRASMDIWPAKRDLENSKISIRIPKMTVNGQAIESRLLVFDMNYKSVEKRRGKGTGRACPSTHMIFHWND